MVWEFLAADVEGIESARTANGPGAFYLGLGWIYFTITLVDLPLATFT